MLRRSSILTLASTLSVGTGTALMTAGARNELLTIPDGGHGRFTNDHQIGIVNTIRNSLASSGLFGR